jgi:ankyrin repeat protein
MNINDLLVPKSKEAIIKELNILSQEEKDKKLLYLAYKGQIAVVKLLIEVGADVNAKNINGTTVLMWASRYDKLEIVKYLIENGADINAKNFFGSTALNIVICNNKLNIINLLKKYGAKEYK